MANVTITINDRSLSVPADFTILEAARANGIRIPTLCFMEKLSPHASCRMCVVEVEGARTFQHACAAKVREGMVVHTDTEAVRKSRKLTLQLLLSDHSVDCHHCLRIGSSKCDDLDPKFCEMCFFCDCVKDGFCELQALAREYGVDVLPFTQKHNVRAIDHSSVIIRNPNKCIKCRRCVDVCGNVQTVHNLSVIGRGCEISIAPAFGKTMTESDCIGCGRCVDVCPTGAIYVREHKDDTIYYAHKYGESTIAQISENILPELARLSNVDQRYVTVETVAAGMKKIGFDYIMCEAASEEKAVKQGTKLLEQALQAASTAVVLTNSPAATKFIKREYPEIPLVAYPSAQEIFRDEARAFASSRNIDLSHLYLANLTNFNENAVEAEENDTADFVINARELHRIFLRTGVDLSRIRPILPDVLGKGGETSPYKRLFETAVWNLEPTPEIFTMEVNGRPIRCAVCHNLGQARKALAEIETFDVIRVIA